MNSFNLASDFICYGTCFLFPYIAAGFERLIVSLIMLFLPFTEKYQTTIVLTPVYLTEIKFLEKL